MRTTALKTASRIFSARQLQMQIQRQRQTMRTTTPAVRFATKPFATATATATTTTTTTSTLASTITTTTTTTKRSYCYSNVSFPPPTTRRFSFLFRFIFSASSPSPSSSASTARSHTQSHFHTNAAMPSVVTRPVDQARLGDSSSGSNEHMPPPPVLAPLVDVLRSYHARQAPVVVRGAVEGAPATKRWSSLEYWKSTIENENNNNYDTIDENKNKKKNKNKNKNKNENDPVVAVELGGSYGSASSERAEIPLSAYLQFLEAFAERYGTEGCLPWEETTASVTTQHPKPEELVYMAQNDLLPALYPDVWIPDCCRNEGSSKGKGNSNDNDHTSNENAVVGLGRLYSVMMWLGPRGCVSPLHFDPLDNCLMQHAGRKRVLLFAPSTANETTNTNNSTNYSTSKIHNDNTVPWHYAGHDGQQSNTSPIDPEVLDWWSTRDKNGNGNDSIRETALRIAEEQLSNYPLFFQHAPERWECVLEPGDLLYIPARWWHHVRSIDASASVNVWWR